MRTINFTIKIEDNDLIEHKVRSFLENNLGSSIVDIKTLPNTEHLKDYISFKKLLKSKREAQKNIDKYIDLVR